jgi:hypothetical protein
MLSDTLRTYVSFVDLDIKLHFGNPRTIKSQPESAADNASHYMVELERSSSRSALQRSQLERLPLVLTNTRRAMDPFRCPYVQANANIYDKFLQLIEYQATYVDPAFHEIKATVEAIRPCATPSSDDDKAESTDEEALCISLPAVA